MAEVGDNALARSKCVRESEVLQWSHLPLTSVHESEGRLTLIVFSDSDEPQGLTADRCKDPTVREHVRVHTTKIHY